MLIVAEEESITVCGAESLETKPELEFNLTEMGADLISIWL
jgi:hypothetical protein